MKHRLSAGHFRRSVTEIRKRRITRMLVPNHYREHVDHIAAYMMGAYDAPQVGDAHTVDWAEPHAVISTAQYSVWAELDPEDALLHHRDPKLRGDTVLIANGEVEREVQEGLEKFVSQTEIIADLMIQRKMRRLADGRYIEVYLRIDPRPKLDFEPYKRFIENL